MLRSPVKCTILALFAGLLVSGCSSLAPSAYLNSSALAEMDTSRGFCVQETSLDPRRINASKAITQMLAEAGFDTSCADSAYSLEWSFEAADQQVDHAHVSTFCTGYGYWQTCSGGHGATLISYQRSFQVVVSEGLQESAVADDAEPQQTQAVWVASVDSRGSQTDYVALLPRLMEPVIANLGKDRANAMMRLKKPAKDR